MSIEAMQLSEYLGTVTLATGGLGAAAYGVVDGLKLIPWIDLAGFERLFGSRSTSGKRHWPMQLRAGLDPLLPSLQAAYGADAIELLKAQYRSGRSKGELPRTLRQGVRIGFGVLSSNKITQTAQALGINEQAAQQAATALVIARNQRPPAAGEMPPATPTSVSGEERSALARLETTIDARIDAALVLAEVQYVTQTKVIATMVALSIAFIVGYFLGANPIVSLIIGLAAVPLAPVAKDLATALQEAVRALKK
jgi:hypothetical protein